jgi:hypothetical protein
MRERSAVRPEFESEVRESLKRIERGVNVIACGLGQFEEVVGIMDMKFEGIESVDKWMREIAAAVGVVRTVPPRT